MNKKGFIRIVEAVLAIIIVFVAILAVLPESEVEDTSIPYELESSADSILEEIENNEKFRACILGGEEQGAPQCITGFVDQTLPFGSALDYAFLIRDGNTDNYYYSDGTEGVLEEIFPPEANIYAKSVFLSVEDVTAPDSEGISGTYKTLRLYFWFKIEAG